MDIVSTSPSGVGTLITEQTHTRAAEDRWCIMGGILDLAGQPLDLADGMTVRDRAGAFVLTEWQRGGGTEYVTHAITYCGLAAGHYFTDYDAAYADMLERAAS